MTTKNELWKKCPECGWATWSVLVEHETGDPVSGDSDLLLLQKVEKCPFCGCFLEQRNEPID